MSFAWILYAERKITSLIKICCFVGNRQTVFDEMIKRARPTFINSIKTTSLETKWTMAVSKQTHTYRCSEIYMFSDENNISWSNSVKSTGSNSSRSIRRGRMDRMNSIKSTGSIRVRRIESGSARSNPDHRIHPGQKRQFLSLIKKNSILIKKLKKNSILIKKKFKNSRFYIF